MIDFLKAHPSVSKSEYMWDWTIPQIRLALYDNTHIEYLTEKQAKIEKERKHTIRYDDLGQLANDLGMPIFG